ncbi:MAG: hypothetical protein K9J21_07020 [Bacteroidales bacterium]|nr:hypothetical protein [Bacteroidales bacterium]
MKSKQNLQQLAKRKALLQEFEKFIAKKHGKYYKEVPFKELLQTKHMFRADYFIPAIDAIVEINGGQWINGRHNRAAKKKNSVETTYESDLTKLNLAQSRGYVVFQFTYEQLARRDYIKYI